MAQPGAKPKVDRVEELNSIGAKFFSQGQFDAARLHFLAALSINPMHADALHNLGSCLRQSNHYAAAESVARRSLALGDNPFRRSNLAISQFGLRRYVEALATLETVVRDIPHESMSWHNYGLVLYILGRYDEALAAFDKSLALSPTVAQVQSDRALALLSLGRIQEGLSAYEVRWKLLHRNKIWTSPIPEWQGEPLAKRRILVHHEQGFGDSIMLSRFLTQLSQRGCAITLAVPSELKRLMQRSFRFIRVVDLDDEVVADALTFDYHVPMMSLMRWLGIAKGTDINAAPYIYAKQMTPLHLPLANFYIGICWASGKRNRILDERRRTVPLMAFLPLTEIPGVSVISLQKGPGSEDIVANGMEGLIFDVSSKFEDFAATADVMAHMDLIISVDSAVAHLAGATGRPTLMLSPYTRCWRWWDKATGRPWYNRMHQYHQQSDGSWQHAMNAVVRDVQEASKRHMLETNS